MTKSQSTINGGKQGKWTRIRPLQRDELDAVTHAGMRTGEITWGTFPNNLCRVMAYLPRLMETEVPYANSVIFDQEAFRDRCEFDEPGRVPDRKYVVSGSIQVSGFNDRFLKELVISKTSLLNRSLYSITHHAFLGYALYSTAGRGDEAHEKYLHLHEHHAHPDVYTPREMAVLSYTTKVTRDPHGVTDDEFNALRWVLREHNDTDERLAIFDENEKSRHVDAQIVELTWLIGHFCMLNRWFTVLQVPDEDKSDELNFLAVYEQFVPEDIRQRNARILNDSITAS
ncbi:MAG: carboxymuconolactone decarboxylase family protein [Hyphomicrobiales bacterium]|nr:carboxymuconolactone decarboxylase family protein [Hyphomicrobiales bacterium]